MIYRYGGDEFIVLSKLESSALAHELEMIKIAYRKSSENLYSCKATFSAGIIPIRAADDINSLISKSDEIMYISKHSGKNKITVKY